MVRAEGKREGKQREAEKKGGIKREVFGWRLVMEDKWSESMAPLLAGGQRWRRGWRDARTDWALSGCEKTCGSASQPWTPPTLPFPLTRPQNTAQQ